ncbi:MAG: nitroreductase [Pseudomonadales bacterium]
MIDFSEAQIASFEELVRARRSVRGFLPQTVPDEILQRVFELARWSPSGTNVQPWRVCVASGEACDEIRRGFLQRMDAGEPIKTDHLPDGKVGDPFKARKRDCAKELWGAMGVAWEDREGRAAAYRRNYELFDAPHVVFLGMHELFGAQTACDVGMYAQTLMLAMTAHGIASCSQGTLRNYPDYVREVFGLAPEIKILFGISFGYEDESIPANNARVGRAPMSETVQFIS